MREPNSREPKRRRRVRLVLAVALPVILLAAAVVVAVTATRTTDDSDIPAASSESSVGSSSSAGGAEHVHLGDSYAAGTGSGDLVADSSFLCQRTEANFGRQLARLRGWTLTDVSCAGATTDDMTASQYDGVPAQVAVLGRNTRTVTLTIGGNDQGLFSAVSGRCVSAAEDDPDGDPCRRRYGDGLERAIRERSGPALHTVLARIRAAAPNAEILVPGYPWLVPAKGGCGPALPLAAGDIAFVRELQGLLNSLIAAAAVDVGGRYVDVSRISDGRDACAPPARRWITPLVDTATGDRIGVGALHPNKRGQSALARAVAARL